MRIFGSSLGIALVLMLSASNCKVKTMEVPFIQEKAGLKPEHTSQVPLMERVYNPPGTTTEEVMRVYPDGSLYFYGPADSAAKQWGYLTKVKPAGVAQLTSLFEEACAVEAAPPAQGHNLGAETFRYHTGACDKEVVIHGVEYGKYSSFQRVTMIVNGNLEPISLPK